MNVSVEELKAKVEALEKENLILREYKDETIYRLVMEDVRYILEGMFPDNEIEEEDVQDIGERAKFKLELEWDEILEEFIKYRFPEIVDKYKERCYCLAWSECTDGKLRMVIMKTEFALTDSIWVKDLTHSEALEKAKRHKLVLDEGWEIVDTVEFRKQFDGLALADRKYSHICPQCAVALKVPNILLDEHAANGICGVEGCQNEAEHYIDFN